MDRDAGRVAADGDGEWAFEVEWTGRRALIVNEAGLTVIGDAAGDDISHGFPELRRIGRALGSAEVVLDGVITADDIGSIDRRLSAKSDSTVRRIARIIPSSFIAFDLLWSDGSCCDEPWTVRRDALDELGLADDSWSVPAAHVGDGAAMLEAAGANGVDALIAKRTSSPYRPGERSDDWLRVPTSR